MFMAIVILLLGLLAYPLLKPPPAGDAERKEQKTPLLNPAYSSKIIEEPDD